MSRANTAGEIDGNRLLSVEKVFIDGERDAKVTEPTNTTGTTKEAKNNAYDNAVDAKPTDAFTREMRPSSSTS